MKNLFVISTLFILLLFIQAVFSQEITLPYEVRFNRGDDMEWANPGFDDSRWGTQSLGKSWKANDIPTDVYAWYRIKIVIPESLKKAVTSRNG